MVVPVTMYVLLEKALNELTGIETSKINEAATRKSTFDIYNKTQTIDFTCDFVISRTGNQGGGHSRKGFLEIPRWHYQMLLLISLVLGLQDSRRY